MEFNIEKYQYIPQNPKISIRRQNDKNAKIQITNQVNDNTIMLCQDKSQFLKNILLSS